MITKTRVLSIVAILTIAIVISTLITTNTLAAKSRHPSHPSAMNSTSGFAKINNDTNSVTIGERQFYTPWIFWQSLTSS